VQRRAVGRAAPDGHLRGLRRRVRGKGGDRERDVRKMSSSVKVERFLVTGRGLEGETPARHKRVRSCVMAYPRSVNAPPLPLPFLIR
jgi:hypothetical protein